MKKNIRKSKSQSKPHFVAVSAQNVEGIKRKYFSKNSSTLCSANTVYIRKLSSPEWFDNLSNDLMYNTENTLNEDIKSCKDYDFVVCYLFGLDEDSNILDNLPVIRGSCNIEDNSNDFDESFLFIED